jgi:hypothetical protein
MADSYAPALLAETDDEVLEDQEGEVDPLDRIEALLEKQLQSNAALIQRVTGREAQAPQGQPLQKDIEFPAIDMTGLPDPRDDVNAFNREYAKRFQDAASKAARGVEQRVSERVDYSRRLNTALDRANKLVQEANPNLDDEAIGAISQVIAARMKAEGKNPQQEILRSPADVAQEIVDYADDWGRKLSGRRTAPVSNAGRAQVLRRGSGAQPGGRAQTTKPAGEDPLDILHSIQKEQRTRRLY